jgi:hypothetical protein
VPLSGKALYLLSFVVSWNLTQCLRHFIIFVVTEEKGKEKTFSLLNPQIGLDLIDPQYITLDARSVPAVGG